MKILVIQLRQLGDILLTTPMIGALYSSGAEVHFLCHRMGLPLLRANPQLTRIHTYHQKDSLRDALRLIKGLRGEKYAVVFDFMNNPRSAFLARVTGAQKRYGFSGFRSWAYTHSVPKKADDVYIVQQKAALLEAAGIPLLSEKLSFSLEKDPFQGFFAKRPTVVMSPTHRREARQWTASNFAEISDYLVERYKAEVFWLWGPGELDFVKEHQKLCKKPSHLAPETTIEEMASFLKNADYFIGTSNGPSHVAVAMETPSLQLHGPTKASSWCPSGGVHIGLGWQGPLSELPLEVVKSQVDRLFGMKQGV